MLIISFKQFQHNLSKFGAKTVKITWTELNSFDKNFFCFIKNLVLGKSYAKTTIITKFPVLDLVENEHKLNFFEKIKMAAVLLVFEWYFF